MPQLIRTPEEIFRAEAKDIYVIRFQDYENDKSIASKEIEAWISTNLPGTLVEPLAPSEYSGWIIGYFGDLRIDFSEDGLGKFCARWETPEGKSIDDSFQCYLMPYQAWFEKYGHYVPSKQPPTYIGVTAWIDTPIGFIYHQLNDEDTAKLKRNERGWHPANPRDLWVNALRLWPELKDIELSKLAYGRIHRYIDNDLWVVSYSDNLFSKYEFTDERKAALREWFKLPIDVKIQNEWG